jgi:hypothetical protein
LSRSSKQRRWLLILVSTVIGASSLVPDAAADPGQEVRTQGEAATPLAIVSEDPYTNLGTFHRTQVEPDSFAFGSTVVSVFQSGRSYHCGASNIGWSVSHDAGASWTEGFLPSTTIHASPSGEWMRASDPVVAYDAKHDVWLAQGIGIPSCPFAGGDVFVSRSTDGAQTFGDPVIIQREHAHQLFDKNWIVCDNTPTSPFYGKCYATWDDGDHHLRLHASTSSDGGLTWSRSAVPRESCALGGNPVVQPSGTVIFSTFPVDCEYGFRSWISKDGGASYSGPFDMPAIDARGVHGNLRVWQFPSADVDADGKVYVAWSDCRFRNFGPGHRCVHNDIVMSTSTDGHHWSHVIRIPIDARTSSIDHFLPAIAVDPSTSASAAHIGIVYYFYPDAGCNVSTCDLSVGFASSVDGGDTWADQRIAGPFKTPWFPLTTQGYMVGDYFSVSFASGKAIPVFIAGAEGDCERGDVTSCDVWTASATISFAIEPLAREP